MQAQGAPSQDISAALNRGVEACFSNVDLHRKRFEYAIEIDDTFVLNDLGVAYQHGERLCHGLLLLSYSLLSMRSD